MSSPVISTTGLSADLSSRSSSVRVCIIGSGEMGTDLVSSIGQMSGIEVSVLVDRRLQSAHRALEIAGLAPDIGVVCATQSDLSAAHASGKIAIVSDAHLGISSDYVDVVIEATGRPIAGAEYAMATIDSGKHLVMMNVETDVTIGSYLQRCARDRGVVYTIGAGDEPTAIMELYDFVSSMGFPIIAAGKGKNNAFCVDAIPSDYIEEASRRNMNPRMLVEFVDGSKTAVEMGCVSNATGLVPDCSGMHGPDCALEDLHKVFCPKSDGGILENRFCVDYTLGSNVAPGVFVIAEVRHPRLLERMNDLHFGEGPYYTFYRPYHLTSLEVPLSAARAVLYGKSDMRPLDTPVSEVCALAKRDLCVGETLDCIGEECYRSWLMRADVARSSGAVPVGLLEGGTVKSAISKGSLITHDSVAIVEDTKLYELRQLQDSMRHANE